MKKHGMRHTPEYKAWAEMKQRCLNQNSKKYKWYGGRGIQICPEWIDDFKAFFDHIGPRPSKKHSLDRIDNDGGYMPGNVRWATQTQQTRNQSQNKLVTAFGETKTLAEWAEVSDVSYATLWARINAGKWTAEECITMKTYSRPK